MSDYLLDSLECRIDRSVTNANALDLPPVLLELYVSHRGNDIARACDVADKLIYGGHLECCCSDNSLKLLCLYASLLGYSLELLVNCRKVIVRKCIAELCDLAAKLFDAIVLGKDRRRTVIGYRHGHLLATLIAKYPVYLVYSLSEHSNVKTYREARFKCSLTSKFCDLGCTYHTCKNCGLCSVSTCTDSRHSASKTELKCVRAGNEKCYLVSTLYLCTDLLNERCDLVGCANARVLANSYHISTALDSRNDFCRKSCKLSAESILCDKLYVVGVFTALCNGCLDRFHKLCGLLMANELHLCRRHGSGNLKSLFSRIFHSRCRLFGILGCRYRHSYCHESVLCNCGYRFYKYFLGFVVREFGKLYCIYLGIVKKSSRLHSILKCGAFARL